MLRRLLGATLTVTLVASALQWSTPEATVRAARHHPWIWDALWYGWLVCTGAFFAVLLIVCPTVMLLRRRQAVLRPLVALTFSLSVVTTYLIATSPDGEFSRHLWLSNTVERQCLRSVACLLLTAFDLDQGPLPGGANRPPVEHADGSGLDPI